MPKPTPLQHKIHEAMDRRLLRLHTEGYVRPKQFKTSKIAAIEEQLHPIVQSPKLIKQSFCETCKKDFTKARPRVIDRGVGCLCRKCNKWFKYIGYNTAVLEEAWEYLKKCEENLK